MLYKHGEVLVQMFILYKFLQMEDRDKEEIFGE